MEWLQITIPVRSPGSDEERAELSAKAAAGAMAFAALEALADELDNAVSDPDDESEWSSGYASGQWYAAERIRAVLDGE